MTERPAAAYLRISSDPEGTELGVARQLEDIQALVASHGLPPIPDEYIFRDNDRGASARSRKPREEWERLIALVDAGVFGRVYAWSNSRLTRRPREYEVVIDLHAKTGVEWHTVKSGKDDLSTADGRLVARIKADMDVAEAERASERLLRWHQQVADHGRSPGGTRPFGWMPNRIDLDPVEAAAGRQVIAGFLSGETLHSLVRGLQSAGLTTTKGNNWTTDALRKWLANPRLCGWRELNGVLVQHDGVEVVGSWEPLVDPRTWSAVRSILDSRKMKSFGPAGAGADLRPGWDRRQYLLSGLLVCGRPGPDGVPCMTKLRVTPRNDKQGHKYVCPARTQGGCGRIGRDGAVLDAFVTEAVLTRAESLQVVPTADADDAWEGESDLERLLGRQRALLDAYADGEVSEESYFTLLRGLDERIRAARAERDRWTAARLQAASLPTDLRAEWDLRQDDLDWRRSMIFRHLEAVVVLPVGGGRRPFNPDGVRLRWRQD